LVLPTRILRTISWVLTATKTQALEFTFKLDLRNSESVHQSVLMKAATTVARFGWTNPENLRPNPMPVWPNMSYGIRVAVRVFFLAWRYMVKGRWWWQPAV
jgi:hypothetical protein